MNANVPSYANCSMKDLDTSAIIANKATQLCEGNT